jgi:signal transduction histidine kinase
LECASAEHLAALHRSPNNAQGRQLPSPHGLVTVGAFSWHTATISRAPALIALREVSTPSAVLTQGFAVPVGRLDALLAGSIFPASIRPGPPIDESEARIALQGDPWTLGVDSTAAMAAAGIEATKVRFRFYGTFALGALAAMIAGVAVVLLVRQTDRTATERARFAASAAHELRTPLAGLRLYGEMLADDKGDPTRRKLYARRVADEADRLARVVSNVLGFAHLQRGGLSVELCDAELEPLVRESVARLRPALDAEGVPVDIAAASDVPMARLDPGALHQIVHNLLDNAAKFNRDAADRTVHLRISNVEGHPTLEVVDHGAGVVPSLRRRLFQPFAHHPDPGSPAGLGIGLAIVRALAEAQGARVSHRAPTGGGACFVVRFDAAR